MGPKNEDVRFPMFQERFNQLRGDMSITDFAALLSMSRQTVGFYLNGTRIPDVLGLRQISEKCKVSTDWLLGLSDIQSTFLNEHSFQSLHIPENFVNFLVFAMMNSLNGEYDLILNLLGNGAFLRSMQIVGRLSSIPADNDFGLEGTAGCNMLNLISELKTEVLKKTNGHAIVCDCRTALDGEMFLAQNRFANAVEDSYYQFWEDFSNGKIRFRCEEESEFSDNNKETASAHRDGQE